MFLEIASYYIVILSIAAYLSLYERKLIARMQLRYGPRYCGPYGIYQPIADGLKLLFKQNIYKHLSFASIFAVALLFLFSLFQFAFLPIINNIPFSLMYVIAIHSLIRLCDIFIGITSKSKYGLSGGIRGIFQKLSGDILYLLILLFISQDNSYCIIPNKSSNLLLIFLYFIVLLININRTPFDFIEAESELVAGSYTEYGGMLFGMIYISDYLNILFQSILFILLFLTSQINIFSLAIKAFLVISLIIIIRGVLPRYLQNQLISLICKILIPILFILNIAKYYI